MSQARDVTCGLSAGWGGGLGGWVEEVEEVKVCGAIGDAYKR